MERIAFSRFEEIQKLETLEAKQKAWLEDYEGLNHCRALNGKHFDRWQKEPKKYNPSEFTREINLVGRLPSRLVIEFDEVEGEPNNPKESLEVVKKTLRDNGFGYILSTHGSKNSDYLWVEFEQNLTEEQSKQFMAWICPEGSRIDLNFTSFKKIFPVLFAPHWKYNQRHEMPIEYHKGIKIDIDKINLPSIEVQKIERTNSEGFDYVTYNLRKKEIVDNFIWDEDQLIQKKVFPMDTHKDFFYYGLLLPINEEVLDKSGSPTGEVRQVRRPCLITSKKQIIQINNKTRNTYGIDFENIPSYLPHRWELPKVKQFLENDSKVDICSDFPKRRGRDKKK